MCLGVPDRSTRWSGTNLGPRWGRSGSAASPGRSASAYTPEVEPGDWVLVHVGFAISRLNEEEAGEVFQGARGDGRPRGSRTPSG